MGAVITLDRTTCQNMAQLLAHILADSYVVYLKTQNFHWNIVDPRFYSLHLMFEKQYEELAEGIDEIAERIRMIQGKAPGTMSEFLKLTSLKESSQSLSGNEMLQELLEDHQIMAGKLRSAILKATELGDDGSMDMLTQRLREHEKMAWMIQSHL